ncbi:sporulation integral membrane protein YlbJ [Virgibacillus salarius]|uniref:sporulation integral membrane protein YlbJ n=1 Tax=Virgibacillus salarius TaxID=447199 RepID=UPI0024914BC4|nr:sporulation integral membrane protein YlbJ [Virgibacillus salarius]WBX79664.1 sporulation integral membrane protein YlbJ [Virgibacillus salarius]
MSQIVKTILLSGTTAFIAFSLIQFSDQTFEASIRGLSIWWEVVFPSLLPFFITAELLISFGVVKFIGVLFEPIMRPLFNIPGVGSFGWIMGMASGYPTGAKIASRLREEKQLTQIEAERLVSFTNASSPLFIFAAVSVGFFHDTKLGILLAACHYISNAFVGICMRFYGKNKEKQDIMRREVRGRVSIVKAFKDMHETRLMDNRPLGEILGDAVLHSVKTLVMVGGFIILFSVLTKLFFLTGISTFISVFFQHILQLFSMSPEFGLPLLSGLFEITIGAQSISGITSDTLLTKAILVSFILGFNGLSVQAQVASILAKTDIRFAPYFFARILHGMIAAILTIVLYKPLYLNKQAFDSDHIAVSQGVHENIWNMVLEKIITYGPIITIISLGISIIIIAIRLNAAK